MVTHTDSVSLIRLKARADSAYQRWIPLIKGDWVAVDYLNELLRTKSAYQASRYCLGASTLVIDTMGLIYDTANTRAYINMHTGWNNHEGYSFLLDFANINSESVNIYHSQLERNEYGILFYYIDRRDTLLKIISKVNGVSETRVYKKLKNLSKNHDLGLTYVPAQLLISGTYKMLKSDNPTRVINFYPDGKLNGLLDYESYEVLTDYVVGPMYSDLIMFGSGNNYTWRFSGDTLRLYDFIEYTPGAKTNQGALRYELLRLNQ